MSHAHPQPGSASVYRYSQLQHTHMFLTSCQRMKEWAGAKWLLSARHMQQVCTVMLSKSAALDCWAWLDCEGICGIVLVIYASALHESFCTPQTSLTYCCALIAESKLSHSPNSSDLQ